MKSDELLGILSEVRRTVKKHKTTLEKGAVKGFKWNNCIGEYQVEVTDRDKEKVK